MTPAARLRTMAGRVNVTPYDAAFLREVAAMLEDKPVTDIQKPICVRCGERPPAPEGPLCQDCVGELATQELPPPDSVAGGGLAYALLTHVVVAMILFARAFSCMLLWDWFVVPLGFSSLGLLHSLGLTALFSVMVDRPSMKELKNVTQVSVAKMLSFNMGTILYTMVWASIAHFSM